MTTDGILISQIKEEFGDLSYDNLGQLDRTYLATHVFGDPEKLKKLNSLVHPRVGHDFDNWTISHSSREYLLKEAALLYEAGSNVNLDRIIVVFSPVDLRIKRVLARDRHRSREQVEDIMKRQLPDEEKRHRADHVIYNDEQHLIIPQVLKLHQEFKRMSRENS
jgi:dephospho-CoA kinase